MNIDNLISKYLDGELSENEDLKLRNIISSNEKARDIFNTYIDLHIAAKEDAKSIETPEDIFSNTEDKVLMAIMSANASSAKVTRKVSILNIFPRQLASMVAVLLLISFTYTADLGIFNKSSNSIAKSEMVIKLPNIKVNEDINQNATSNKIEKNINVATNLNNVESVSKSNLVVAKSDELNLSNENKFSGQSLAKNITNTDKENIITKSSDVKEENLSQPVSKPTISILDNTTSNSEMQFGAIDNRIRPNQNNIVINNVQLTAFSSSPYTLYGFDKGANASLHSYSQAVSLSLNDKTNIGLEIGYSDISYRGETFTSTNVLDKYGRETGQQIVFRTERDKEYALYWGQVFMQTQIYKINKFDLGLRLGLGMSGDGFNSNSKLMASYELIDGIKLMAGSEFTYFNVSLPQLINAYTTNYYSFAMIYGLQFSF